MNIVIHFCSFSCFLVAKVVLCPSLVNELERLNGFEDEFLDLRVFR